MTYTATYTPNTQRFVNDYVFFKTYIVIPLVPRVIAQGTFDKREAKE